VSEPLLSSFDLSFAAVDILSAGLRINCRVFPFQLPSIGYHIEERIRIAQAVRDDLRRRGLSGETDLEPGVERGLRLLAEPEVAVGIAGDVGNGRELCARVSAAGRHGVLVVREPEVLRFELIRPEALVRTAVGVLPRCKAGRGTPITFTRPGTQPGLRDDQSLAVTVRVSGPAAGAAERAAQEILRRPRHGGGVLVACGRDSGGRERTAPTLGWIDTDAGRYLTMSGTDQRGDTRTTFTPADESRLAHKVAELVESVRSTVTRPW
jgi:hypothetical protein